MSGTYALLLWGEGKRQIEVGALGTMAVRPGFYVYVGSAFGPGGIRARVQRHAADTGTRHWHVDSLRAVATLEAVWLTYDDVRRECAWTRVLQSLPEAAVPMQGFGSSDCACSAHLFHFRGDSAPSAIRTRLRSRCSESASVLQFSRLAS